jgi:hypothetical protein
LTPAVSKYSDLRRIVRDRLGLSIGPEMAAYVAAKVDASTQPFTIIAQDARTGIPICQNIDPKVLATELRS